MDEILGYLVDDLEACSLTRKFFFDATRPLIHQRLICSSSEKVHPKPEWPLLSRRKRTPGAFER